jgi:hypothetical protein
MAPRFFFKTIPLLEKLGLKSPKFSPCSISFFVTQSVARFQAKNPSNRVPNQMATGKMKYIKTISALSTNDRVEKARRLIDTMVDLTSQVIDVHESNQHLVYSKQLADRIPRNYGTNTYNVLQQSMYQFELLRLTALWEDADEEKPSLPHAGELLDDNDVITELAEELYELHAQSLPFEPIIEPWARELHRSSQERFGLTQSRKLTSAISSAIRQVRKVHCDPRMETLRNIRDKHIAHNLYQSRRDKSGKATAQLRYGYESELLKVTLSLIQKLNLWVCGTDLDVTLRPRQLSRRNAALFWKQFKID